MVVFLVFKLSILCNCNYALTWLLSSFFILPNKALPKEDEPPRGRVESLRTMVSRLAGASMVEELEFGAASWKGPEATPVFFLVNIFNSEPRDFLSSLTTSCFSGSPGFGACCFAEAMMYLAAPSF